MGEAIRDWLDSLNKKIEQIDNEFKTKDLTHQQTAFLAHRRERLKYAAGVLDHQMSTNKFIDGTPIPEGYQKAVTKLMSDACDAEEEFDIDELERHAEKLKKEEAIRAAELKTTYCEFCDENKAAPHEDGRVMCSGCRMDEARGQKDNG